MKYALNYQPSKNATNCPIFNPVGVGLVKLAASNTSSEYIIPEYTPISDQGSIGSCASTACSDILEILKGIEDPTKVVQVSRLFLNYNAHAKEGTLNQDDGVYISDVLFCAKNIGVCPESIWSYDISKEFVHPPMEAYKEAEDNKITEFYQITATDKDRLDAVEAAIRANHPVVYGTSIGSEYENYSGDPAQVFDIPQNPIGGHAQILTGVRRNADGSRSFCSRNSWGPDWGSKEYPGHAWLSDNYVAWDQTRDLFVPTRMIDFVP